jgi:hypothetical protein
VRKQYSELQKQSGDDNGGGRRRKSSLPSFWTVEVDRGKELDKCYQLTSGDPARPEKNHEVQPGWPFAPQNVECREGRIPAFSDWLTSPTNSLFARVAVNRLWQWHFGVGLQKTSSDFGQLGGRPSHPQLLDWLASEFVSRHFSMKEMHRLMVTSETYKLASEVSPELVSQNHAADPDDTFLWHFRLQRLEAEPIWDSIFAAADNLDLTVGGPSFDLKSSGLRRGREKKETGQRNNGPMRRAAYITRGYSSSRDVMAAFLQAFDADDGRIPCPLRTQTVTAPQSLFMMNSAEIDGASHRFADRLSHQCNGDITSAIQLAYQFALSRSPSPRERERAVAYLENDSARLKDLAWLLFNLDEFVYVR